MNKKELRAKYKTLRAQLNEDEIDDLSIEIANRLLQLPIWDKTYYHIFLPITKQKEINTEFIMNILQGKDKYIVISKSDFEKSTLEHFLLTDGTRLKTNEWGIPEPVDGIPISEEKLEIVFVPLLGYDQEGNRIGYGKGFYDKFLSKCNPAVLKIGLSFFAPEEEIINTISTDIRLDLSVTPEETYCFKN
ncbi:5-formyltetrahydrofolate cyclo-ligase [Aquimarina gracilis]|uniref:5-formyltetrahydrofolate cyclo-ligase n=1 Tax=Aquimarina gracilis TaxID=874422 RepID=A0ABU6A027_9FLAO|nr:5-formyltetrahydrofolate cyclo-ligase [Aquimarina gracilis]MEB3347488.1 5-formyltetrahydrofolate cyclo-ligase [Aquimarina gracilis]